MENDPRYIKLKAGLNQLEIEELQRIINWDKKGGRMMCDTYIYEEETDTWCPLAVGLGVPQAMENIAPLTTVKFTDANARKFLEKLGYVLKGESFTLNPISGVEGFFYTENRKEDLINLCEELIKEKELELKRLHGIG